MNYNEFQSLADKRASHRKFLPDEIAPEDIKKVIDVARLAPSGHNNQPWKYVAIKNNDMKQQLAQAIAKDLDAVEDQLPEDFKEKFHKYRFFIEHFVNAPVVFVTLLRKDAYISTKVVTDYNAKINKSILFDMEILGAGASINNLLLAAESMGFGTCWMTEPIVYSQNTIEKILEVEEEYHAVSVIVMGKPVKERKHAPKKAVDEILKIVE